MSSVPTFRTVVFVGESSIQVFRPHKDTWRVWEEEFAHDSKPTKTLKEAVKGSNILLVVSDAYSGHVQLSLPNKKEQWADDRLAEVLQDEYQIDLSAYEFASQRFAVGRQFVQVSVSGIEKEAFARALAWVKQLSPKKLWVMPFGWFVSTLKSVEPALIAVVEDNDRVHASHHYLGVDDARQISLDQLAAYGESRKEERKETHLLYVQANKKLFDKIEKEVGESLAVHPLIAEFEGEAMEAVVNAVMDKGPDTLKELLHFEPTVDEVEEAVEEAAEAAVEMPPLTAPEQAAILEEGLEKTEAPRADELPKPELPPAPSEVLQALRAPEAPPMREEKVEDIAIDEPVGDEIVGTPVVLEKPEEPRSHKMEVEEVADKEDEAFLAQLQLAKVAPPVGSSDDRYIAVAPKAQWKTAVLVFLAVFFVTALVGGGIFWSQQDRPQTQALIPSSTPSPSPSPVAEATPEPDVAASASAELKKGQKVIILNATGVAGLAGKVKTQLEKNGWVGVKTGNATGTSYADAIFVMADDASLAQVIGTDLGEEITPTSSLKETGTESYDIVIVLAKEPKL
jgi:hypothetical protein